MCAECDTFQSVLFFSNEEMPQICNSRDCPFRLAVKKNGQKGNGKGRFALLQQRVARFQFHSFSVHTVALDLCISALESSPDLDDWKQEQVPET